MWTSKNGVKGRGRTQQTQNHHGRFQSHNNGNFHQHSHGNFNNNRGNFRQNRGYINDIRINEEANRNSFPNRGNYFPNQGMFIAWGAHQGNYQQLQNFPQQSPTMVQPIHNQQLLHPLGVQSAQQHPLGVPFGQHTP